LTTFILKNSNFADYLKHELTSKLK